MSTPSWFGHHIAPGERLNLNLVIASSFSSMPVHIPVHVWRAEEDGPNVFVSAAVHGDEINGTGAIRELIIHEPFALRRGTMILIPVVNVLGFERHARYLPDRRDLNRCFPGSTTGSMASRMARVIMDELVTRCQYGIDLHTAAVRRTNFPNVRADMSDTEVARMAKAFGCEIIIDGKGPKGSLRVKPREPVARH